MAVGPRTAQQDTAPRQFADIGRRLRALEAPHGGGGQRAFALVDYGDVDVTGVKDSAAAWTNALDAIRELPSTQGVELLLPYGLVRSSVAPLIDRQLIVRGQGGWGQNPGTRLIPDPGVDGLRVTAAWTAIEDLAIQPAVLATADGDGHAINATARVDLSNIYVNGMAGDGIHIDGNTPNNANNWHVETVRVINCRNGLWVEGGNGNQGSCYNGDFTSNRQWGVFDDAFLGNHYFACHTNGNRLGPYTFTNPGSYSSLFVCYSEANQPPSRLLSDAGVVVSGLHGAGFTDDSIALHLAPGGDGVQLRRGWQREGGIGTLCQVRRNAADGQTYGRTVFDASYVAGNAQLTSASAAFSLADVGRTIMVDRAGAANAVLTTTIAAYVSPTEVTMATAALSTNTNRRARLLDFKLTSASIAFTAADVGATVRVEGAGATGSATAGAPPLQTTIAAYVSATEVTLTAGSPQSVTGARISVIGKDGISSIGMQTGTDPVAQYVELGGEGNYRWKWDATLGAWVWYKNNSTKLLGFSTDSSAFGAGKLLIPNGATFTNNSGSLSAGIYVGSGSPEGSVTANVGSLYLRTDGGAGTSFYIKESGTGNTGWRAV